MSESEPPEPPSRRPEDEGASEPPEQREALKSRLEARLRPRGAPGPFSLGAKALAVRGLA